MATIITTVQGLKDISLDLAGTYELGANINLVGEVSWAQLGPALVQVETGSATSTTANKLVDSGQNFLTTVDIGDHVYNTTDDTWARVTAIDSDTTLSISSNIMASGEG